MKNLLKKTACFVLATSVVATAVFAAPSKNGNSDGTKPEIVKAEKRQFPGFQELSGKISVTKIKGAKVLVITTDDNKVYVLNAETGENKNQNRPPLPPKADDDSENSAEKDGGKNLLRKGSDKNGNAEFRPVTFDDLLALNGKKVKIEGRVNEKSNVVTVARIISPAPKPKAARSENPNLYLPDAK